VRLDIHWVPLQQHFPKLLSDYLLGRYRKGANLPDPDILLAAGHGTHLSLLCAKHALGGYAVVLMKPSLPLQLFDLVVAPYHDGLAESVRVLPTHGAINKIRWSDEPNRHTGVILIGGPSKSHGWNDDEMVSNIERIKQNSGDMAWQLTTSPRTPESFLNKLQQSDVEGITVVPFAETSTGWVAARLAESSHAWVSEDSVSMVYEALSSGAAVGVLPVPRIRTGRVVRCLDQLVADHLVTSFGDWCSGAELKPPTQRFNEAERAAKEIIQRLRQQRAA
jgi:mitochondrial fission protein ELM1